MKNLIICIAILCMAVLIACRRQQPPVIKKDTWADYRKAYNFGDQQRDSAFYYFNKSATNPGDSAQTAMSYNNMAVIQVDAGDYYGAQESLSLSLRYTNRKDPRLKATLSKDYNELGLASIRLKDQDAAIAYFNQAILYATELGTKVSSLNNKALAYQEKGAYTQALAIYTAALAQKPAKQTYARILNNLATTKWLARPTYNAAPELRKALAIRRAEKDNWGENSSYGHLAEFYSASRLDSALYFAHLFLQTATQLHSPDDQLEALEKLIENSPTSQIKPYFKRYQQLRDSLQKARNAAKNQFALIRYNVERQRTENLRLQKDNTESKYQLLVRNILLLAGFVLVGTGMILGFAWYRRYKRRKEQEKQDAVRQTWRKASKDVHDSLSTDIYLLMKRVRHDPELDRNWLQQQTELVYQRSRDISYEIMADISDGSFPERLAERLMAFGTEDIVILLILNNEAFWGPVSIRNKLELRLILQQLMVNMQKHSGARNVIIRFQVSGNIRSIIYTDDGKGIPQGTVHQNGLTNAETRIKEMGGSITFGNIDGKGLKIQLDFPVI